MQENGTFGKGNEHILVISVIHGRITRLDELLDGRKIASLCSGNDLLLDTALVQGTDKMKMGFLPEAEVGGNVRCWSRLLARCRFLSSALPCDLLHSCRRRRPVCCSCTCSLLAMAVPIRCLARGTVLKPYDKVRVRCPSQFAMLLAGLLLLGARFVPAFRVPSTD